MNTIQTAKLAYDEQIKNIIPGLESNSEYAPDPNGVVIKTEPSITIQNDFSTETESVEDASELVDMVFDEYNSHPAMT